MAKQVEAKALTGEDLYETFLNYCFGEISRADNLAKRMSAGWSFDLGYCALFMGSLFVVDQRSVKERIDYLNKLWDIFYYHEIGPERAGVKNYIDDFQWEKKTGGDKIARYYETDDGRVTFDIVLRLPYNGNMLDWEQVEYLKHLAEDEDWWKKYNQFQYEKAYEKGNAFQKSTMLYDQALGAEYAFKKRKEKDLEPQIKEVRKKLDILEKRKDKNSYEYKVWSIHESDITPEDQPKSQFYSIDTIEYNGKHWKEKDLRKELTRLEDELKKGQNNVNDLYKASEQVVKDFQGRVVHLTLAALSVIPTPIAPVFALLDAAYEIYEMKRDGDSLDNMHALSIGMDCVSILPVIGGVMKTVGTFMSDAAKVAQRASLANAAVKAKNLSIALESSLNAAYKHGDAVVAAAKARQAGKAKKEILQILKEEVEKTGIQGTKLSDEELVKEISNAIADSRINAKKVISAAEDKYRTMGYAVKSKLNWIADPLIKSKDVAETLNGGATVWSAVMGVGVNSYCLFNGDPIPDVIRTKTEDDYKRQSK